MEGEEGRNAGKKKERKEGRKEAIWSKKERRKEIYWGRYGGKRKGGRKDRRGKGEEGEGRKEGRLWKEGRMTSRFPEDVMVEGRKEGI